MSQEADTKESGTGIAVDANGRRVYPIDTRARARVALRAGVSFASVCRYLQGRPVYLAIQRAIEQALDELKLGQHKRGEGQCSD